MEGLSDPFDSVLLTYGQLQEQAQQPPRQRTPEEIIEAERIRARQQQMQDQVDEAIRLRDWDDRVRLVESQRAQIYVAYWRGIAELDHQSPSLVEQATSSESESPSVDLIADEVFNSGAQAQAPLNMDTAETESDTEDDNELRLRRDTPSQSQSSGPNYSPAESPMSSRDLPETDDSGSDGLSDGESPPPPTNLGPTRWLTDDTSEPELNVDAAESSSDSSLGTVGPMLFEMEMDELDVAGGVNEEVASDTNNGSDNENEFDDDIDIAMSRPRVLGPYDTPPREPIAIRSRNFSARDMAELDMRVFLDEVRGFSIGFHLNVFSWLVMRRVRRMRETALPGSFEHLLLYMFDDIRHVTVFQADVLRTGIQNYMQARREGGSHDDAVTDESSQADSALEPDPSSQRPASMAVPGGGIPEDPLSTNAFFARELRALRLMVAPLRDCRVPFAWITGRTDRPVEMLEQFQASRELIARFKRRLVASFRESETCKWPRIGSLLTLV